MRAEAKGTTKQIIIKYLKQPKTIENFNQIVPMNPRHQENRLKKYYEIVIERVEIKDEVVG